MRTPIEKNTEDVPNFTPIAVIGISCRLPRANDPEEFWQLLRSGGSGIREVPGERWNVDKYFDAGEPGPGRVNSRSGGFLDNVAGFDAGFFGISPREAATLDLQQRLVLELGWEALENAGTLPATVRGTRTGVFVGATAGDYAGLIDQQGAHAYTRHAMIGLNRGLLANRLSYFLGLRGPSLTVDTAQSSALAAVHLACESLRHGESSLALAGGVNLNLAPHSTVAAAQFGALSPDGRCYTFDARANGYVRGEGGGFVLLKPLAAAVADGDPVYCVIRGSALNNDGGGPGLTAPHQAAQEEVLLLAYAAAGVDPAAVQYVELHGTGTRLGDPIEAAALGAVLGAGRDPGMPLAVGSAKTNVGHLEGAAGIVGLPKTVLAVRHREVPASLNFVTPNPAIAFDELRLRVQQEAGPWPRPELPLLAGVNSFGMGGTNCHVIVEQAPEPPAVPVEASVPLVASDLVPWVVSGKSPGAVEAGLAALDGLDADPGEVAWSLATARTRFDHRAVRLAPDLVVHGQKVSSDGRVVFVFPGQGSQWAGMAEDLMARSPRFREHMTECEAALAPFTGWRLSEVLRDLDRVDVVQPALFAVMVSLAKLWQDHGVRPAAVIGHSQGEIAAAHVAGILSLSDAARLRSAWLINPPGFADGESLPAGLDAAVDVHADAVAEHVRGRPVVLVGYSSGGLLAHAVTRCLEDRVDVQVAGLVLLDTYLPGDLSESMARSLHEEVFERGTGFAATDFAGLTAMGRYLDLFAGWQPAPVNAPTLIVRPERRVPALPGDQGDETPWQARWNLAHDLLTVAGDHCTMVTEFGADTGRAVHDWLRAVGDQS
ncbi:alpha/beta fold hydrolase [Micromonospora sp. STR1s_6]|uniref:Alpha/beta fold hydrolase n=1 Tax=Micromonospora tarensis TaxID=2806100 RepID=A0ABS1YLC9_9ACTN|nr:alpha/beta fold hydrolase [Micromonospora tarensis]